MKQYTITMKDLLKEDIYSIALVLENCEGVTFYSDEIKELNVEFEAELKIGGTAILRRIRSGSIIFKINEKKNRRREINFVAFEKRKPKTNDILDRLTGMCDICNIHVTYKECYWQEYIEVPYDEADEDDEGIVDLQACSTAKINDEGNLIILMGELSEWKSNKISHGEIHHA